MSFKAITAKEYRDGLRHGRERLSKATIAEYVRYNPQDDSLYIKLPSCIVSVQRMNIKEFSDIPQDDMKEVRLSAIGDAIAVGSYDVQVDLGGLLADVIPKELLDMVLARRGGRTTSPAKAQAARTNGIKGGRPRKIPVAARA